MDVAAFFHTGPLPPNAMEGHYSWQLVLLSYVIASLASFVALDITERLRSRTGELASKVWWLVGGALAMGMGIWTMHFIGMLAFIMPMPMSYEPWATAASLIIAVIVSAFAFFLIKNEEVRPVPLMLGGVLLGMGIVAMHYMGMSAMVGTTIRYIPGIFLLSVLIALVASEAALWLMIQSSTTTNKYHNLLKVGSSLVMGLAICGMHYTGMEAAVFTVSGAMEANAADHVLNPNMLSLVIGTMTILIISIALFASKSWTNALQAHNKRLQEAEAILEEKSEQLQLLNQHLGEQITRTKASEGRIRAVLAAAGDGIIVADEAGTIEMANRMVEKMFGFTSDELAGQNIFSLVKLKEHLEPQPEGGDLIEKHETLYELTVDCKGGGAVPIELNISKSRIGHETLYIVIMRDITERKAAEEKMAALNGELVVTARLAGMAEVATCILHNVGNVLNSINVSTNILLQREKEVGSRTEEFSLAAKQLAEHHQRDELDAFFKTNRVGQILPEYLMQFADYWRGEHTFADKELEALHTKVQHIKNIVNMQQSLCRSAAPLEPVDINVLLDDALMINSEKFEKYGIDIRRRYGTIPPFEADRVRLMQTLVNLIKNSVEALEESRNAEKVLTLTTSVIDGEVRIDVADNGAGIAPENLTRIFSYGFTTKKGGHGFGLHSSAISIQQMGGSLTAASEGPGKGATFILKVPQHAEALSHPAEETMLL